MSDEKLGNKYEEIERQYQEAMAECSAIRNEENNKFDNLSREHYDILARLRYIEDKAFRTRQELLNELTEGVNK